VLTSSSSITSVQVSDISAAHSPQPSTQGLTCTSTHEHKATPCPERSVLTLECVDTGSATRGCQGTSSKQWKQDVCACTQASPLTVALVPRLTEGGTTLSYLEGVRPVRHSAVSAAATCGEKRGGGWVAAASVTLRHAIKLLLLYRVRKS
jgi:hypothetical protein